MAHDNPTLQGADRPSRFLAWTGPQWLLIAGCGLLGRLVLGAHSLWWLVPAALPALVTWLMGDYRLEPYARNGAGWLRRRLQLLLKRPLVLGLVVEEDHIQTPDGLRLVVGVDTTSLDALTRAQQDALCDGLARLARTRQPGQTLQLVVINRALDGAAVLADLAAAQAPDLPADLAALARHDMAALQRQMRARFVGTLGAYVVVGAPVRKLFSEQDALSGLRRAADTVRQQLGALGLGSRVLGGEAVRALLEGEPLALAADGAGSVREEHPRYLRLPDGRYAATIALLEPCEVTSPGYLAPLIAGLAVPYRLALHIEGLDRTHESRRFSRRRNVETDEEAGQAGHGKALLQSQRTGVVRWGVYLTVQAPTLPQLRWAVGQALELVEVDLPARPARLLGHQLPAYWATLPTGYDTARRAAEQFMANVRKKPELEGSIQAGIPLRFQFLNEPAIAEVTGGNDVDFHALGQKRGKPWMVYVVVTRGRERVLQPLIVSFFTQLFDTLVQDANRRPSGQLERPVICELDEAGTIGKIADLAAWLNTLRSAGVWTRLAVQTVAQLVEIYGEVATEAITQACQTFVFFGGSDVGRHGAEWMSKQLGQRTAVQEQRSAGRRREELLVGQGGLSRSEVGAPLMAPDDFLRMRRHWMVVVPRHDLPMKLGARPYTKLRRLRKRAGGLAPSQVSGVAVMPAPSTGRSHEWAPIGVALRERPHHEVDWSFDL